MFVRRALFLFLAWLAAAPATALPSPLTPSRIQTADESWTQDAGEYARRYGVRVPEAVRRLRAQQDSVATTDRLQAVYRDRLAGIAVDHGPAFAITVLLTGSAPVPETTVRAGGVDVPIRFRTGAPATREQVLEAMATHRDAIRRALPAAHGMGLDGRTGELVVLVSPAGAMRAAAVEAELEALTGVPVRVRRLDRPDVDARRVDAGPGGGARVEGSFPGNGERFVCTTGFVVTDGARTGVVTAAHCPDLLTYRDPERGEVPLSFEGGWGVGYQDVQVHVGDRAYAPLFYADTARTTVRRLAGARARASTRTGDVVCRRGESAGYSCAEVELTNYAPPGDLCGGPCDPVWVTVAGPSCRGGDSGGPVFLGSVAFGIVKGANYDRAGRCNFYYYMSTDYLPEGWSLLADEGPQVVSSPASARARMSPSTARTTSQSMASGRE